MSRPKYDLTISVYDVEFDELERIRTVVLDQALATTDISLMVDQKDEENADARN